MKKRITATTSFSMIGSHLRAAVFAVAVIGVLFTGSAKAEGISGAIFTTNSTCSLVNANQYPSKDAVYINGGPSHPGAASLPDGSYHVMVTTPDGDLLGTSVNGSSPAPVQVANGRFVNCYQLSSILFRASNGQRGFDDTTNPGCVYKVWVSQDPTFPNNLSKTDTFKVDCKDNPGGDENHPPRINVPGPQTIPVGQTLTFTITATDQDNDQMMLTAANLPSNSSFNGASGLFSFIPAANQAGQVYVVTFTATDTRGASSSATVQITVTASGGGQTGGNNHAPSISVPGPQTISVGQTLTFTVTATDQDNDQVTLTAGSVPPNGSFNGASGLFSFIPAANQAGQVYVVTFTATDTRGASSNGAVQITVTSSGSGGQQTGGPVISVPPGLISGNVGSPTTVTVSATSLRSDCPVRVTISGPPNVSFDENTGILTFTPTEDQQGKTILITVTATDCTGQSTTATVTVVVRGQGSSGGSGQGAGRICVPVTKIFFCETEVDSNCGFLVLTLTNEGGGMLNISSVALEDGTHFRIEGVSSMPMSLQSAGVVQLKIMFTPKDSGKVVDNLIITTDDPDNPTVTVQLRGRGVGR